ncbi:NADH-quinone oxidoreductase subunit L [Acidocella sp.]|uniref:NADH-quinone oxidoreductase subunit L n=1 Tax=Acidocella sp. TaxID=50710 RepID=UPI0026290A2D|nr:NADH-quinone oxidoreductase subunit L [Acidocella sp.]MDD2795532.1 NADH-quinone oxidoreductase subunit L [Acidocella sp.]
MHELLWLVPTLPLLGSVILMLGAGRLSTRAEAAAGALSVGFAAVIAFTIAGGFLLNPPAGAAYEQTLWRWFDVGGLSVTIGLRLDPLSLVMMLVITGVGFLIHLFATEFMEGEEGYGRFFAYLNLFVAAMLLLVLGDNFLTLYTGWEGVGLCSYLLIGFWWRDPANGLAARKAFIVTRIGDTALLIGLLLIASRLGTLNIAGAMHNAAQSWPAGSPLATLAAFLLLGGAVGKSAQLPLQTWLPDAMAGPTPVSALIHAATMVTAGVYLIARTHALFLLAPAAQYTVGGIGAATLLLAGFSALAQNDIKRILAYSTMSQIGYMFLALGVGAWGAAMFHLLTHAFFKALLFLSAGAVTMRLHHEQDIYKMGGLARRLPVAFWSFLIGSAALAALPLVTAGFYSKEAILSGAWADGSSGRVLWAAGVFGAFITGLYIFRAVFIAFFGEAHTEVSGRYGWRVILPLSVLSVLSVLGGLIELPPALGHVTLLSNLLAPVLPASKEAASVAPLLVASLAGLLGIGLAAVLYWRPARPPAETPLWRFWHAAAGFDWLYDRLLVRPVLWAAREGADDVIDSVYDAIAWTARTLHEHVRRTQNGRVRFYTAGLAIGSISLIAIAMIR